MTTRYYEERMFPDDFYEVRTGGRGRYYPPIVDCIDVTDSCWAWTGHISAKGYGVITQSGRKVLAHRMVYERLVGPIPEGLTLDHLCRNRACVNPEHLEPVTHQENILRGSSPSASRSQQDHCKRGHPFDDSNTYRTAKNQRVCRTCHAERQRRYRRENMA